MNALPPADLSMSRAEERAYKRGFDAGIEHQKKADPPPKAKQLKAERDLLRAALQEIHDHEGYAADVANKAITVSERVLAKVKP